MRSREPGLIIDHQLPAPTGASPHRTASWRSTPTRIPICSHGQVSSVVDRTSSTDSMCCNLGLSLPGHSPADNTSSVRWFQPMNRGGTAGRQGRRWVTTHTTTSRRVIGPPRPQRRLGGRSVGAQWLCRGTPHVWARRWCFTAGCRTMPSPSCPTVARCISCQGVWDAGTG